MLYRNEPGPYGNLSLQRSQRAITCFRVAALSVGTEAWSTCVWCSLFGISCYRGEICSVCAGKRVSWVITLLLVLCEPMSSRGTRSFSVRHRHTQTWVSFCRAHSAKPNSEIEVSMRTLKNYSLSAEPLLYPCAGKTWFSYYIWSLGVVTEHSLVNLADELFLVPSAEFDAPPPLVSPAGPSDNRLGWRTYFLGLRIKFDR